MLHFLDSYENWSLNESNQSLNVKELKDYCDEIFLKYLDEYPKKGFGASSELDITNWEFVENIIAEKKVRAGSTPTSIKDRFLLGMIPHYKYTFKIPSKFITEEEIKKLERRAKDILSDDLVITYINLSATARTNIVICFFNRNVTTYVPSDNNAAIIKNLKEKGYKEKSDLPWKGRLNSYIFEKDFPIDSITKREYKNYWHMKPLTSKEIVLEKKMINSAIEEIKSIIPELKEKDLGDFSRKIENTLPYLAAYSPAWRDVQFPFAIDFKKSLRAYFQLEHIETPGTSGANKSSTIVLTLSVSLKDKPNLTQVTLPQKDLLGMTDNSYCFRIG